MFAQSESGAYCVQLSTLGGNPPEPIPALCDRAIARIVAVVNSASARHHRLSTRAARCSGILAQDRVDAVGGLRLPRESGRAVPKCFPCGHLDPVLLLAA